MPLEDFEQPVATAVRTQFLTSRAAARHMIRQRSGLILLFGGYGDPVPDYYLGGFQVVLNAVESLRRQLASELGPQGIRALTLQTGWVPERIPENFDGREVITEGIAGSTMLKRAATLEDVGNVAAFAAPDLARTHDRDSPQHQLWRDRRLGVDATSRLPNSNAKLAKTSWFLAATHSGEICWPTIWLTNYT